MAPSRTRLLVSFSLGLITTIIASAQTAPPTLQPGQPIERKISPGQTHSFLANLTEDQVLLLVLEQRGIDVVVRVFSPAGKRLGEYDSPNGTDGPENVSVFAATTGEYRIDVTPLDQFDSTPPGKYEIKIVELRHATDQEIQEGKNQDAAKAKGLALLGELTDKLSQIRLPETRVRAQLTAARLLRPSDEKGAAKLFSDAMDGVKEYISSIDVEDAEYYQTYQLAMQLRQEVVQALAPYDPDAALAFISATQSLTNPDTRQPSQPNRESQLEASLAAMVAAKDPKRTLQLAQDALKKGYPISLLDTLNNLAARDSEIAGKLAREIAAKLQTENLAKNVEVSSFFIGFLRVARGRPSRGGSSPDANPPSLLSDSDLRDLFQKAVNDVLSFSASNKATYSPERNAAQNLVRSLKSMASELQQYAPERMAAIEKKSAELMAGDSNAATWSQYQNKVNTAPVDTALETASQAPAEIRDQLYQQVAARAASTGDLAKAKQILNTNLSNPVQRRQALANLEQQEIYALLSKGKVDDALRTIANLPSTKQRLQMISHLARGIGPGQKRATALASLEMARTMVSPSMRAEGQEQMNAMLEIARAFGRYDSRRAFELLQPLVTQFNDLTAAALVVNGFGQQYYREGELMMHNGNMIGACANQLIDTIASLATANFDQARVVADQIGPFEVRVDAYLMIARAAIGNPDRVDLAPPPPQPRF